MATKSARTHFAALLAIVVAAMPSWAADELTRDQLIEAMVVHTKDARWECTGDYSGCSNLRSAFPRFLKSGNELLVESLVIADRRNLPFHRAVMINRRQNWDEQWRESWEVHFHVEYYDAGIAFPMAVQCQPSTVKQFRCRVAGGAPFEDGGGGFRNYELTWYR